MRKREVSMKDFLKYSLSPVAWSLDTPIGNVCKYIKSDLLTWLENKINLVNQIPADAARVYDGMCIIRQLPTGFDNFQGISDYVLKRITSHSSALIFFLPLINTGKCQLSLVCAPSRSGSMRITTMRPEQMLSKQ